MAYQYAVVTWASRIIHCKCHEGATFKYLSIPDDFTCLWFHICYLYSWCRDVFVKTFNFELHLIQPFYPLQVKSNVGGDV